MTSIENLYSNFNDSKSIIYTSANFNKLERNSQLLTTSLNQGSKFNKYQKRIINQTKPINNLENNNIKEGFQDSMPNQNSSTTATSSTTDYSQLLNPEINKNLKVSEDGLSAQTNEIISNSDYTTEDVKSIASLKKDYGKTMKEYQDLINKVNEKTNSYFDMINPNNPYLNKTVHFTTGHIAYVTNKGIVKYIPSMEIWDSVDAPKQYIQLDIPWLDSYSTAGTPIPTKPPLVSGTFMEKGQRLGYEGSNILVNTLVNNPESKYIGCYNDKAPITEIEFVPVMNKNNDVGRFKTTASSVYKNNNTYGPWAAFDRNKNTFWHSADSKNTNYDGKTGEYTGTTQFQVESQDVKGEWLQIMLPQEYTIVRYEIQGRQGCCGDPNGRTPNSWIVAGWDGSQWFQVDKQENQALSFEMKSYFIKEPKPYIGYIFITTNCGNPGNRDNNRYCVQISQWNLFTTSNYSANANDSAMISDPSLIGYTDYETCKTYAINNGFKYFGMQDGKDDGTANCLVSNDLATSQIYGEGLVFSSQPLWSSETVDKNGITATLNTSGALSVINSESLSIFSTDNSKAQPGNYLGCYGDSRSRAMSFLNNGKQQYSFEQCQTEAENRGYSYFGLQNSVSGTNAQCAFSNDITQALKYGKAGNCTQISDGTWSGGGWSNSIYNAKEPESSYFLILRDDGDMCIYRGTSPTDNQGYIWRSGTNGKQQQPNSNFAAEKGKYGKNWMGSGSTLAVNEFIGSNDGSIYLIMQTDGNLVLYTSSQTSGCKANSKDIMTGGSMMNALFEIINSGFKENVGKLAHINENSELKNYESDNIQLSNEYTILKSTDTPGNDIQSGVYGNATIEQCKTTCNDLQDCYGFVFDNNNNVCYPKNNLMYPYNSGSNPNNGTDIYIRGKKPIKEAFTTENENKQTNENNINSIDSVQYQNYNKATGTQQNFNLKNATQLEQTQLKSLEEKLNTLSNQISGWTTDFSSNASAANDQSNKNIKGLSEYLIDLKKNNNEIKTISQNMNSIVNDSDIVILQKNYSYLFWSILAAGTVLISMNVLKK